MSGIGETGSEFVKGIGEVVTDKEVQKNIKELADNIEKQFDNKKRGIQFQIDEIRKMREEKKLKPNEQKENVKLKVFEKGR